MATRDRGTDVEQPLAEDTEVDETEPSDKEERRQDRRIEVDLPIRLRTPVRSEGRMLEISAGGIRVEVTDDLSHVMHVSLDFDLPGFDETIGTLVDVRWHKKMGPKSEPRWICGLRFSELDERFEQAIESFIADKLDAEPESEVEEVPAAEAE